MTKQCKDCGKDLPEDPDMVVCEECESEYVPDDEIIIEEEDTKPQEPRTIPTIALLSKDDEAKYIADADKIYKYYADVREKSPAVGVLGFPMFYKFIKDKFAEEPAGIRTNPKSKPVTTPKLAE